MLYPQISNFLHIKAMVVSVLSKVSVIKEYKQKNLSSFFFLEKNHLLRINKALALTIA